MALGAGPGWWWLVARPFAAPRPWSVVRSWAFALPPPLFRRWRSLVRRPWFACRGGFALLLALPVLACFFLGRLPSVGSSSPSVPGPCFGCWLACFCLSVAVGLSVVPVLVVAVPCFLVLSLPALVLLSCPSLLPRAVSLFPRFCLFVPACPSWGCPVGFPWVG